MRTQARSVLGALLLVVAVAIVVLAACKPKSQESSANQLYAAAEAGDVQMLQRYLSAGGSLSVRFNPTRPDGGESALHVASLNGRLEAACVLLAAGADPNAQDNRGQTPLTVAIGVESSGPELVELLLKHGANPELPTKGGRTALLVAAQIGDPGYVRQLLKAGADVNVQTPNGDTPLHLVAKSFGKEWAQAAQLLIEAGADPYVANKQGLRFIDTPRVKSHPAFRHFGGDAGKRKGSLLID